MGAETVGVFSYIFIVRIQYLLDGSRKSKFILLSTICFFHIPASAPTGWNFSAFLAIMFNFIIFYPFMKYGYKTFWIKQFVRYSTLFTYIALPIIKLVFLCSTCLGMWGFYSVTDFRITKCQIMLDLCMLRRGDFFLYSSLGVYITSFLIFLSLFLLVFGVAYPKMDNNDFYITLTGEKP